MRGSAHIGGLQHHVAGQFLLDAQIVLVGIGGAQMGIDKKDTGIAEGQKASLGEVNRRHRRLGREGIGLSR